MSNNDNNNINNNDDDNEVDINTGPLTLSELIKLRRMINDDIYRRRVKKMVKVWLYTLGTVASMTAGGFTAWKEFATRFWK